MHIQLPDGTVKEYPQGTSALDVARSIGDRLAQATIAGSINGSIVDATRPLEELSDADPVPLRLLTHATRRPSACCGTPVPT